MKTSCGHVAISSTSRSSPIPSGIGSPRRVAKVSSAARISPGCAGASAASTWAMATGRPASRSARTSSGSERLASSCQDSLQASARRVAVSIGKASAVALGGTEGTVFDCRLVMTGGFPFTQDPKAPSRRRIGVALAPCAGAGNEFLGDGEQVVAQVRALLRGIGNVGSARRPVCRNRLLPSPILLRPALPLSRREAFRVIPR